MCFVSLWFKSPLRRRKHHIGRGLLVTPHPPGRKNPHRLRHIANHHRKAQPSIRSRVGIAEATVVRHHRRLEIMRRRLIPHPRKAPRRKRVPPDKLLHKRPRLTNNPTQQSLHIPSPLAHLASWRLFLDCKNSFSSIAGPPERNTQATPSSVTIRVAKTWQIGALAVRFFTAPPPFLPRCAAASPDAPASCSPV